MERQPFSVCICVYEKDNPVWFEEAINSILNQTVKPDEVVFVVDGPVPETTEMVLAKYEGGENIRIIRLSENMGHGHARRTGLKSCTHELVAIMDADDISIPDRFEKQLEVFSKDPELTVVGGQIAEFIDDPEKPVGIRKVPLTDAQIKRYLKERCPMNQVTVMLKRSAVEQVGDYADWYCNEDYYLWNRMYLADMKFANLPDLLVNVRVGEDMYQRRGGWPYFCSELKLQNYMLKNHVIGIPRYLVNVVKRLIIQVLLPCKLRSWVFQTFARE